jgi:hypothetical protein
LSSLTHGGNAGEPVATVNLPGVMVCSEAGEQVADADADADVPDATGADELLADEPQAARSSATTGATAIRERRTMKPPRKARDSPAPAVILPGVTGASCHRPRAVTPM